MRSILLGSFVVSATFFVAGCSGSGTPSTPGNAAGESGTGGLSSIAGSTATNNTSAGNTAVAGGGSTGTGTSASTGGSTNATSGTSAGGNQPTGGGTGVAGSSATGGSSAVGGTSSTGTKAAGGTSTTGGTSSTGTKAAGGTSATGGTGTKAAGGTSTTGGSSSTSTKATGGTSTTGGTKATGGTSTTGGVSGTGGGTGIGDPPDGLAGVIIVLPGDVDTSCVPKCTSTTTKVTASEPPLKDTAHPDGWDTADGASPAVDLGQENGAYCALSGTQTSLKRTCTTGQYPPSFVPPAVSGATHDGFYTSSGKIYDAKGNEFIMRGISNAHVWYDTFGRYLAYNALDNIAPPNHKTNVLRVVWQANGPPSLLAEVLARVVELKMVPMVELHDATGDNGTTDLTACANYWTGAAAKKVAQDFRQYLLINIANEWTSTENPSNYVDAYKQAIKIIRDAGLTHLLVIDAPTYGQIVQNYAPSSSNGQTTINNWFNNAKTLLGTDTNLLFSAHLYELYGTAAEVSILLNHTEIGSTVPFIIGEFANKNNNKAVAYKDIMSQCQTKNIGWISWSWHGNSDGAEGLDMTTDWESSLTSWGTDIFTGSNGIDPTGKPASIFN